MGATNPRLTKLYHLFMSPCCWQQNLSIHQSPVADQLRRQIQTMVQEGRSDDEIKAAFIREYSKRILAMPEGTERWWLDLTPGAFLIAGLFVVVAKLRVRRQTGNRAP